MNLPTKSSAFLAQPKIYYIHPLMLKGFDAWKQMFEHAADLGFDAVLTSPLYKRGPGRSVFVTEDFDRLDPVFGLGESVADGMQNLTTAARQSGLKFMLDLVIDRVAADPSQYRPVDPRITPQYAGAEVMDSAALDGAGLQTWASRIQDLVSSGVKGFRCLGLDRVPSTAWQTLLSTVRGKSPDITFLAWTPGTAFGGRLALTDVGFDSCFSSLAWWDFGEPWFIEEYNLQRAFGSQIAFPEPPFSTRTAHGSDGLEVLQRRSLRALQLAEALGDGLLVPMGFEYGASMPLDPTYGDGAGLDRFREDRAFDLTAELRSTNKRIAADRMNSASPIRLVAGSGKKSSAILQADGTEDGRSKVRAIIVNKDLRNFTPVPIQAVNAALSGYAPIENDNAAISSKLHPAEVRCFEATRALPIETAVSPDAVQRAVVEPRIAIEHITPNVDDGRFPVKRIMGDVVRIEADIFADGHDLLAAAVAWRAADDDAWHEVAMSLVINDRWSAEFSLNRLGRHEFIIQAWKNPFAIFRYELGKKSEAGLDLTLEIEEGKALVRSLMADATVNLKKDLETLAATLSQSSPEAATALFLSPETSALMASADRRPFLVKSQPYAIDAERKAAGFASWYQIFPRSQSGDADRHGTFTDVMDRLHDIKAMGFDVLYFPPIHPIGSTNRKGRNNSLNAGPNDPGSPYAIGSADGGHDAIHPQLGTFDDFRYLVEESKKAGLEIALDFAIQASPDHPWLKDHPGWFDWRPDGSIRYAENPPKKYEDIVNVDFYTKDAMPALWVELRDVVQKWVDNGVKLFRVDNPHTKPLPFWEWLIGDIRARHPEVVFLSEAFTRPKVMYRLAKVGFSQSYTYFTWRNEKWELEQYMRELTGTDVREFFRPHFFVNTHDINPDFLQNAPRPAYVIRAALAATLSGLWGVYNGFELCEGRPDAKRKEYADSEKYEIRAWDYDRPGNIIPEITMLNRIRRDNSALHSHLGLTLLATSNEKIMFFEKADPGRDNVLLIAVSLDPSNPQEGNIEIPLWLWGQGDGGALVAEDLVDGHQFTMRGKWHRLRLDPWVLPFAIWRVRSGE